MGYGWNPPSQGFHGTHRPSERCSSLFSVVQGCTVTLFPWHGLKCTAVSMSNCLEEDLKTLLLFLAEGVALVFMG